MHRAAVRALVAHHLGDGQLGDGVVQRCLQPGAQFGAASIERALAVERLEKCVVGTQEDWAGARRAIDHWFPWLSFDDDVRRNVGFSDAETRQTLRPELSAAIEKCNACDLAVYEAATRRVEAQKEFLDERAAILVAERGARAG